MPDISIKDAMKIEVGKEIEFAVHRLKDIIFLAESTQPVSGDWKGYAEQGMRMIANLARNAHQALTLMEVKEGR